MDINAIFNFLPGWKRPITVFLAVTIYAWHLAFTEGMIGMDVPSYVYIIAGLFGYNALSQGSKNDAAKAAEALKADESVAPKQS